MKRYALAIDIGGTNTKFALIHENGEILESQRFRTHAQRPFDEFSDELFRSTSAYLKSNSLTLGDVCIGVGCPNYSFYQNRLIAPPNLGWGSIDLKLLLEQKFDSDVHIENDANVAAMGEKLWGGGKDCDDFIVLTVGTGIGTGVFSQGSLLRGHSGLAGEGGHIIVGEQGRPCGCGGFDHFESYCSVPAIKNTVLKLTNKEMRYHDIVDLFRSGDSTVLKAFEWTSAYFAKGLNNLVACFSPQKIILAGGGMVVGEIYLEMIQKNLNNILYRNLKSTFDIEVSSLSTSEGAILGAAAFAFEREFKSRP